MNKDTGIIDFPYLFFIFFITIKVSIESIIFYIWFAHGSSKLELNSNQIWTILNYNPANNVNWGDDAIISSIISLRLMSLNIAHSVEISIKFSNDFSLKLDRNRVFVNFNFEKSRSHFT